MKPTDERGSMKKLLAQFVLQTDIVVEIKSINN